LQQIWTQFLFLFLFVGSNSNKRTWDQWIKLVPSVKLEWEWDVPLKKKAPFQASFYIPLLP
jgi:hypothetical protein